MPHSNSETNTHTGSTSSKFLKLLGVCLLCVGIIYGLVVLVQWIAA